MIDLARKSEVLSSAPVEAKQPSVYYPSLHISDVNKFDVPDGEFYAKVKLKRTGSSESTDEKGKKRFTCSFDVLGIEPGECCDMENESEDGAEDGEEPQDAAAAIMEAMKGARQKKIKE